METDLLLGVRKELSDVLFRLTDELIQNFWPIDDLRFPGIQHLAYLSGHEGLSRTGRPVQEDT